MSVVIRTENLGKRYRLGVFNRRMLYEDMQRLYARLMGREDKLRRLGQDGRPIDEAGGPKEIWALRDVNIEIKDGDVVGIIGRNGSGKSTLLKILSKITGPTTGSVEICGQVASLLEVGTGFHPELTGRENIYLNGSILGMKGREIDARLDEIIDFSGVEKFLDTPVKRYSSGMQVRLAFAVAAHLDPDILVIDEVLAVGDAAFQHKCLGKIGDVARDGRTVLFVSHNAAAVENLCRRGIVLNGGQVVFTGTQTEALAYYGESLDAKTLRVGDRPDHRGNGAVRIHHIECKSPDGTTMGSLSAGRDAEIWLHFQTQGRRQFKSLHVEIFVTTQFEVPVFTQSNRLAGEHFEELPETGAFVCRIPKLPLPSTSYRLSYLVRANMDYELLDGLDRAVDIHVEGGDFFGEGEIPPPQCGVCLVDGQWELVKSGSSESVPTLK